MSPLYLRSTLARSLHHQCMPPATSSAVAGEEAGRGKRGSSHLQHQTPDLPPVKALAVGKPWSWLGPDKSCCAILWVHRMSNGGDNSLTL